MPTDFDEMKPNIELIEENTDEKDNLQQSAPVNSCRLSLCIICNESVSTCHYEYLNAQKVRLILMAAVVSKNIELSTAEETIREGRNVMCTEHLDSVYKMMCSATGATDEESVSTIPVETIIECIQVYNALLAVNDERIVVRKPVRKTFQFSLTIYFRNYFQESVRREIVHREKEKENDQKNRKTDRIMTESDKRALNATLRNVLKESNMELNMGDQKELLDGLGVPDWVRKLRPKRKRGRRNSEISNAPRDATLIPETEICESEPPKVRKRPSNSISRAPISEPKISKPDPPVLKWKESVLFKLKEKQSNMDTKVECLEVSQTEKVILNPEESVLARLKRKRMEMEMRLKEPKKEPKEEPDW